MPCPHPGRWPAPQRELGLLTLVSSVRGTCQPPDEVGAGGPPDVERCRRGARVRGGGVPTDLCVAVAAAQVESFTLGRGFGEKLAKNLLCHDDTLAAHDRRAV